MQKDKGAKVSIVEPLDELSTDDYVPPRFITGIALRNNSPSNHNPHIGAIKREG
jgi:hypothetical protein